MALSQSSQFRGRAGVPSSLGSPRQRHRSASRHITRCHRADLSVKANVHQRNLGDSSLQEGDQVQIFSHSGGMWADGRIMSILEEGHVWVEYKVGNVWCGKVLHILSEHLTAHSTVVHEYDPQAWWLPCLGSRHKQLRAGEGLLGMEVEPSQSVDNYADMENPCIRWKPTEKHVVGVETLTKGEIYTMGYGEAAIKLTKNIDVDEDFGNKVEFTVKSMDGRQLLGTGGVSLGAGAADDCSSLTVELEAKISRELTDGEGALSFEFSVPLLRIALKDHDPPADSSPYVSQAILGCTAKGEISTYGSCHAQRGVGIKAAANNELLLQAKVSADFKQKHGKNGYNVEVEALGGPPIKMPRQDKTMQEVFTYLQDRWLRQARQMPETWKVLKVQIRNCKHSESPDPALGEEYDSHMQALRQRMKHPEKCSPDDSVKSLIELIHLGRSEAERVANRHLTMVIGSTGSGKSTLINYLRGCPMEDVKVKGRCVVQVKQGSTVGRIAEIGHGKTSSTFRPSVYPIGSLDLCDCAGYGDTRGMEISIGNAVMLRQLAHHAKGVNFVILFNYNSLDVDRAGGRRQLIQTLISYFGSASRLKGYADAVMLGITRVQQKHETVEDIRQGLCDREGLDQGEVEVLEKVSKNIFVYDPLDKGNESWCNRAQLLQNIREMRVIDREHAACMFETALGAQEEQWLCSLKEGFAQRIDLNMKTGDYATAAEEMQHILTLVENINSATVVRRFADLRESVRSHIQEQIDVLTQAGDSGAQALCEVESRLESMRKDIIHFQYDAELHDAIDRHWHAGMLALRGMEYAQKWNDKEALEKQLQALDLRSVAHTKSDEPEAPKVPEILESTIISPSTDASHADQNQAGRAEHRWSDARDVMSKGLPSMASMRDQSEQCLPLSFSSASAQAMASTHNTLHVPKVEKEFLRAQGQAAGQKNEQSEQARNHQQVQEMIDAEYIGVEYKRGNSGCSKKLHVDSEHVHLSTQSADEMPLEKCHSADPHCDGKGSETQQKNEEPTFRCGDEVHYYRHGPNVWVFATITKVLKESAEVSYELQYEAWDEAPACMKKHKVSEKKLLDMQETRYQQLSQGSTSGVEASRNRSLRTDGRPMWCRTSAKDHIRQVQKGDEVWFKHSNRNAVVAEIKDLHEWEGDDAKVDLTYVGLDEQDVPRRWHKEGVTKGELAILQHPRNWQPSPKRTWCEDKQQAAHQLPSHPQWICEDCDEPNNLMRTECNNCGRARSDPQQCFQTAAALASKQKRTQLHAASRDGDVELVRRLLLQRVDPTAQDEKDGSSALHVAAYHGHQNVLEMLVNQVEHTFEFSEHKNWFGETPMDVARERLRFCPSSYDAMQVFACLFGRDPTSQERASRVMNSISSLDMRPYNQGFLEAVMLCPLIGDRTAPYRINSCDVDAVATGIEKEERRVLEFECQEYDDWSYWRASFARGILRYGIKDAFTRRMDAAKMRQLLHDARNDSSNAEFALTRCAIKLYTAATFLFKATNFAMRSKDHAFKFKHLEPYARLLNYSVRYYADKQPWKGRVHRVLPIYDDETVRKYSQRAKAVYDHERFFSYSGFTSATAWVQECKIFQDLRKYGAGKECIVFIISPDPQGGSVYPVDLGELASFGDEDQLLYPAGQQFKVIEYEGCHTREQFAKDFDLKFDIVKDKGEKLHVVRLQAVDAFTEFSDDFFKEGGNIKEAETFLQNRLQEVRRQGHTWNVSLYEDILARCWHKMGKYEEAESMFRQTLKVREQELGLTHPNTLNSCNSLAGLLHDMGKYEEAEPMFRQTLKVREQKLGLTHPNTLNSCNNLALLLKDMGKYEEAEPMFRQTLKVREQKLGLTHPDTLTSCNNLAALLRDMGKYEEAEPMFRQALKVQEQELGLTHPNTLNSCNNLALLLHDMGKYEEAEPMFRQTLKVQEQELGLTHPNTLTSCNNLAALLRDMGKYEEAEPMYRQTLQVAEAKLGAAHALTRACALGWASVLGKTSSC